MSYEDLLDHIHSRLHLVPRFRQKLAYPPAPTGRPFWVDDPSFNLEYHVRHSALPVARAREEQLRNMAAQDLLAGARPDQAALGAVAGPGPDPQPLRPRSPRPTTRSSTASRASTSRPCCSTSSRFPSPPRPSTNGSRARSPRAPSCSPRTPRACSRTPVRLLRRLERAVEHPRTALGQVSEAAEALGEVGWNFANPAPEVPLNVEIGSHRRFEWVRGDLAQFKRIKSALGGTVNDVVLAVVSGALREWLHAAGSAPRGSSCAPRSRSRSAPPTSAGSSATRSSPCARRCPVYIEDPVERLARVPAVDGRRQGLQAGARGRGDLALQRLRAADPARPGGADQLLDPAVQPRGHQRPRPADPALRARPRARGHLPGRLPAAEPGAVHRDHVLQRRDQLRPARRLRRGRRRRRRSASGIEGAIAELHEAARRRRAADRLRSEAAPASTG